MNFEYKKSLGQNFIYDLDFLRVMISGLDIKPSDKIIEIGAGAGTLTKVLAEHKADITTVEIDERLKPILQKELASLENVNLCFEDGLRKDFSEIKDFRVIANVPYYITTPLIMKFLNAPNCTDINVLVAKEVAERIVANMGTKEYGSLSVVCQAKAKCKILKIVGKEMFRPMPKIDSAFVSIVKNEINLDHGLERLLKGVFASRRKTILNSLSNTLHINKEKTMMLLNECGIDSTVRPENISPTEYLKINQLSTKYK